MGLTLHLQGVHAVLDVDVVCPGEVQRVAVPHWRGLSGDPMLHDVGALGKQRPVRHQHVGHAALLQRPQLIRQAEPRCRRRSQRPKRFCFRQAGIDRLPDVPQESRWVFQPVRGERHRHPCVVQSGGVGRGQFPMLELVQPDESGQMGIRHVVPLRKVHGHRHPHFSQGQRLGALVAVSAAQHDGLRHVKFIQHGLCAQNVFPTACREHAGQRFRGHERFEGQVGATRHAAWRCLGVPLGVEVGLAQQRRGAHQGARVILRRRPLSETHVERRVGDEQGFPGVRQRQHHRARAAHHAVLHVRQQGAKPGLAQGLGLVGCWVKLHGRRRFRADRLVPPKRAFLVAQVLGGAGPAGALDLRGAEVAVHVHERRVQVQPRHVQSDGGAVHRHLAGGAGGHDAAPVHHHGAVLQDGGGVEVHGGVFQHGGHQRFVVGAVDREGWVRLGLKAPRSQESHTQGGPEKRACHQIVYPHVKVVYHVLKGRLKVHRRHGLWKSPAYL